ncbi:isocitrate lyase/phosphoenolpyruvate mutase family protein [Sphingomonas sp. AOB5]|uniref:isocitrate lyase/PEP mutase family protein n=1 Tax=Sphingomonas sp. AOB5 TaxID=3034017 RepID=UPI0023F88C67|nr:isocitrate lyase/phosphoenolpyruvate mutase family protein [Sphingomonas sp. AOB5]MDF7775556.1 isocitrate lyase/phosphoenolpyruvate mutase family protein [Sphingomonas sp. AOB5]
MTSGPHCARETQTLNYGKRGFRPLLAAGPVRLPGISDGLSARLAELAGFAGAYLSGGAVARGMGRPDLGLVTLSELEARVRGIAEVSSLPFLVDCDSGFGGALHLERAVSRIERAGASGLHIDDFEIPRRRRDGAANLLSRDTAVARLKVALGARTDPDFLVIGRTDAAPHLGLDEAIDRANALADAGVDLVYVEHLHDRAAIEAVATRVAAPKLIAVVSGKGDTIAADALEAMGFAIITWPAEQQLAAIAGARAALDHLRAHGTPLGFAGAVDFAERDRIVGTAEARAFEDQFLD